MISFNTHKNPIYTRQEIWFLNNESFEKKTYNVFCASEHIPQFKTYWQNSFDTIYINLNKDKEQLFKDLHSTFRYEIRRSEKEDFSIEYNWHPTLDDCEKLTQSFTQFAIQKKIPPISLKQIDAIRGVKKLCISKIFCNKEEILTHIYLHDNNRIILLNSFHNLLYTRKNIRGYSNKFLHWNDILMFKKKGLNIYDVGGIGSSYPGITDFKLNLGGEVVKNYRYITTSLPIRTILSLYKSFQKK
jgi:hypothetical protein